MSNKICISGLFLYPSKVGGAENYFYNLLKGLNSKENIKLILNKNIRNYDEIINEYSRVEVDVKLNRGLFDYLLGFFEDIDKREVIFSPNYITPLVPFKSFKITTIHDVQYLHFPEFFSWKKRLWLYISHLITLKTANKIVCISNSVKSDIINFFGNKYESKLEVIYNPIDFTRFEKIDKEPFIKTKYILSVAAQYPHKNLLTLIKAFNSLSDKIDYKLVLAGQLGKNLIGGYEEYYKKLNKEIEKNRENIILTGFVSDKVLGNLYKNCSLFVFPSLFEGFGMPPVEAMGFGKPTITTKCASLKEVTMGKAIYVNEPEKHNELAEKILKVLEELNYYNREFDKYKTEIISKYNPKKIANQYENLFNKVSNAKTSN